MFQSFLSWQKVYNKRLDEFIVELKFKNIEHKEGFIRKVKTQEAELRRLEVAVRTLI